MMLGHGGSRRENPPLYVMAMAIALVLAAFAGAGIGLVWQSSGLGSAGEQGSEQAEGETADGEAGGDGSVV